nr:hypothetical protein [Tanacetum cinerariifolium]
VPQDYDAIFCYTMFIIHSIYVMYCPYIRSLSVMLSRISFHVLYDRTSSNFKNKNVDTTPIYKNDNQSGKFRSQRTVNVTGARENVGSPVVQQTGIQCFHWKEFGHFAKECRKPKRVKDFAYHKEKMLLCKQAEKGDPLRVEKSDWLVDMYAEIDEQELEAHYNYMVKIQEVPTADSVIDSEPLEQVQKDTGYNVFANNDQNDVECDDEHVALANLISNLKLDDMDTLIKTCLMPLSLKTQNDSFIFVHELKQEMHADLKYVESFEKEIDDLESDKAEFSNMYDTILQEYVSNDVMCTYLHSLSDLDAHTELQCLYPHKVKECDCLVQKLSKQTESVSKEVYSELLRSFAKLEKHSISLELTLQQCKVQLKNDTLCNKQASNVFRKESEQYFEIQDLKAQLQDKNIAICTYRIDTRTTQTRAPQLSQTSKNTNPRVSTSTGVNHNTSVTRPQHRSTQMKDKVMPNNSQVKHKKTEVEDHPRISSISNKTKSVTTCNDSLKSKTSNVNVVCATCGKCLVDSNHFACVTKMLNDVNTRTKKPNVVPISTRKPKGHANKSVATPPKITVASETTTQKSKSYNRMIYEKTSKAYKWWIEQKCPSRYKWVPKIKMQWVPKVKNENVQKRVSFAIESTYFVRDLQGNDLLRDTNVPSQQELDLLFGPLYDEFFTAGTSSVNKSSSPTNNSNQQDTLPSTNIHTTLKPSTPTYFLAEENSDNQAENEQLQEHEFTNPFCTPVQEVVESSSHNIGNSNVHTFNQPQVFKYRWTKDHLLKQVHGNPSKPVQTRRQLVTDPEMCMFELTMSTAEPKNIKEAMSDSAWIEAMQEELHQFDRL